MTQNMLFERAAFEAAINQKEFSKVLFSSKSDNWSTPADFYNELHHEFNFTFDPCPLNATFDGLSLSWNGNIFINPPYSNIRPFLEKGIAEVNCGNANVCVFLIPARTDTRWFHDLIYQFGTFRSGWSVRFLKGRLKFGDSKNSAPFPSMVCIYRGVK